MLDFNYFAQQWNTPGLGRAKVILRFRINRPFLRASVLKKLEIRGARKS